MILSGVQALIIAFASSISFFSDSNACWDKFGYKLYSVILPIGLIIMPLVLVGVTFKSMSMSDYNLAWPLQALLATLVAPVSAVGVIIQGPAIYHWFKHIGKWHRDRMAARK